VLAMLSLQASFMDSPPINHSKNVAK